jgi:hypothetical protein
VKADLVGGFRVAEARCSELSAHPQAHELDGVQIKDINELLSEWNVNYRQQCLIGGSGTSVAPARVGSGSRHRCAAKILGQVSGIETTLMENWADGINAFERMYLSFYLVIMMWWLP